MNDNYFEALYAIDVNGHTETKNGLTYLSWAWAWAELKKRHPEASYTIYENSDGWNYHTDRSTCWVKVGVTVEGIEYIEYLPVMDFKNKSIPYENVTSTDVNKAIQRAITKAIARHGLGLYLYTGSDTTEAQAENDKALEEAKQALTDFCYSYDASGKVAAQVWKKYKVDKMTDPAEVNKLLADYKAKAKAQAEKKKNLPEEVV
jgi:heterodisulfide reductase subunit B